MRVLILGGNGMLGHKVFLRLRASFPGTACTLQAMNGDLSRRALSIFQGNDVFRGVSALELNSVADAIDRHAADVVINCIGLVKQRPGPHSIEGYRRVNSEFPHQVYTLCASRGIRFIHMSTDCVFSGNRGAYSEEDEPDTQEPYGVSKLRGEILAPHALTIRTSFIGRELTRYLSLLEWFIGQTGTTVRGYSRVWFSGVTTLVVAELLERLIQNHPSLSGVFHLAGPKISKHDLLVLLRDTLGLRPKVVPDPSLVCDRSLRGDRLSQAIQWKAPSWNTLVDQLRKDPTPYEDWRILQ